MGRKQTFSKKKEMNMVNDILDEPLREETLDIPLQDEQVSSTNSNEAETEKTEEPENIDEDIAKMFGDLNIRKKKPIEEITPEPLEESPKTVNAINSGIDFKRKKKNRVVNETVVFPTWLDEAFKGVRLDSKGKVIEGSRGILSQIARNGVIKELVELGVLDKSYLSRLEPYE